MAPVYYAIKAAGDYLLKSNPYWKVAKVGFGLARAAFPQYAKNPFYNPKQRMVGRRTRRGTYKRRRPSRRGSRRVRRVVKRRRAPRRRTRRSGGPSLARLARRVRAIEMKSKMANHLYTRLDGTEIKNDTVGNGATAIGVVTGNDAADIETACAGLRYFNPADPANLTTAPGATGAYSREINVRRISSSIEVVSHYSRSIQEVDVWCCAPKRDTGLAPNTCWSNGLADQGASVATDPMSFPTHSDMFNDLWAIVYKRSFRLAPGQSRTVSFGVKGFKYNPQLFDEHALSYQSQHRAFVWLIRVNGQPSYESGVTNEVAYGREKIYVINKRTYKFEYEAGVELNDVIYVNNLPTITTPLVANQPTTEQGVAP